MKSNARNDANYLSVHVSACLSACLCVRMYTQWLMFWPRPLQSRSCFVFVFVFVLFLFLAAARSSFNFKSSAANSAANVDVGVVFGRVMSANVNELAADARSSLTRCPSLYLSLFPSSLCLVLKISTTKRVCWLITFTQKFHTHTHSQTYVKGIVHTHIWVWLCEGECECALIITYCGP